MRRFPISSVWWLAGLCAGLLGPAPSHAAGQAPSFALRTLDGKTLRTSDFRGQPVVIDFWATWCMPCRAAMPHLDRIQTQFRDQGLVVIGLSVDDVPAQEVRRYAEKLGLRFRLAMASESVLDDYGPIRSIPTTFFINRRGEIVRRVVGYVDAETMEQFAKEIVPKEIVSK